jgi:hypothetical protein
MCLLLLYLVSTKKTTTRRRKKYTMYNDIKDGKRKKIIKGKILN